MKNKNQIAIIALLGLTILSALISQFTTLNLNWLSFTILGLSAIKFAIVAFQFMEMKKAHTVWKAIIIGYLLLFIGVVTLIL